MKILPKKLSKININLKPILQNQIVLYFITFLAVVDMVLLLNQKDIFSFMVFLLIGFLTSFFSKNMIVILSIALVVTHILKYGNSAYINEGFENEESSDDSEKSDDEDGDVTDESKKKNKKEGLTNEKDSKKEDSNKKEDKGDKIEYADLKRDYQDFQGIQNKILDSLKEIDPLLSRAENFIEKFEKYKDQNKDKLNSS